MIPTECIMTRRSVRAYTDREIPSKILEEIVECANQAPSAMAKYPWKFVVVTEKETMKRLADAAAYGKFIVNAAACIVVAGDKNNDHTIKDCSAAVQNILLAAWSYRIGTCWVNAWRTKGANLIAECVGLPANLETVALVPLGFPAEHPLPKAPPVGEVLHWEKF
jgi:nitroreductase